MTVTDTLIDERTGWLDWRRHGIGGSDIAAVLGISPYASPFSLWCDKVGLLEDSDPSEIMEFGNWAELMIGPWFEDRTGLHVSAEQLQVTAAGDPLCRATVDGLTFETLPKFSADGSVDRTGNIGGLEIKALGPAKAWPTDTTRGAYGVPACIGIPSHFQAQTQWQMHCDQLDRVFMAVLMGRRLDIVVIERDQADIDFMVEAAHRFWDEHVTTGIPPAVDGHDATLDALAELHAEYTPGTAIEIDSELVDQWRTAKVTEKEAVAASKAAAARIKEVIGSSEEVTVDGERAASWRAQSKSGFDLAKFRADHADLDFKPYETSTTFRVLRDHAPKEK